MRGLVDLPDMLSWCHGAMVELEAVISTSLTFYTGKLCDNLPVWKESRRVRCLPVRPGSSYGLPARHTTLRFVVPRSQPG